MIRLAVSAVMALAIHVLLFYVEVPWTRPILEMPQSQSVSIDLVAVHKPVEKPAPPKPKVTPQRLKPKQKPKPIPKPTPKPKPIPKSVPTPVVEPQPEPQPQPVPESRAEEPLIEDLREEASAIEQESTEQEISTEDITIDEADDRAAVRASVPLYDLNPPPLYPRVARKRNYQGTVALDVLVTVEGRVADIRIAQSSGYAILDRSAVKSVKGWRFAPARRGDQPFEMWVRVPVRFELQ